MNQFESGPALASPENDEQPIVNADQYFERALRQQNEILQLKRELPESEEVEQVDRQWRLRFADNVLRTADAFDLDENDREALSYYAKIERAHLAERDDDMYGRRKGHAQYLHASDVLRRIPHRYVHGDETRDMLEKVQRRRDIKYMQNSLEVVSEDLDSLG